MIKVDKGHVEVEGHLFVLMGEVTCALHAVYDLMVDSLGEEEANKFLASIGRTAVTSDSELAEKDVTELKKNVADRFGESFVEKIDEILGADD